MTVLIASMSETVLKGVKEGVAWLGSKSLLPEKGLVKMKRKKKAIDPEKGVDENFHAWEPTTSSQRPVQVGTHVAWARVDRSHIQREEIQVEGIQKSEGTMQENTLAIHLAREITRVAKDASQESPLRYTWLEWVQWLKLIDKARRTLDTVVPGIGTKRRPPLARLGELVGGKRHEQYAVPLSIPTHGDGIKHENGDRELRNLEEEEVWKWTWLDDHGPLFSSETETQWVLNELCMLLEEVIEKKVIVANE